MLQPEYNLYARASFEGPLAELCVKEDIGVITYFSLAAGFLTGKIPRQGRYAGPRPRGKSRLPGSCARKSVTAPIASATSLSQLESLVKAATLSLSDDAMALLDEAGR